MKWFRLLLIIFPLALQVSLAQAPSVTINPSGSMTVCSGTTVNVSSTVANAFAGTTSYAISDIPFTPFSVLAGTSLTMPDDTVLGPFPIGFQFCFLGNTYTQFYVGSNGWVGFSPGQTRAFTSNSIPNTTTFVPRNCIMGPWMDFNPGISGGPYIKYQTQGIAPYRRLIVQWTNCPLYQCIASKATFQIVLFESTNVIENYITNKPSCVLWAGGKATQGLHNQSGTVAFAVPGRNSAVWNVTNDGKRYQPNGPSSSTVNWTSNGIPIGSGTSVSTTVNGPGMTRIIGRANFPCSNLIVYDTLDVSIGGSANASFSVPSIICSGQTANFTYTGGSTGTGAWTFQSGTPTSATGTGTASTVWNTPGTYNVGLTVTPTSGLCASTSTTQSVTVVAPPTSTFSLPATVCLGANASISYSGSAPSGSTYTWNFGANASPATVTGLGPHSVSWSSSGSKSVSLTVSNGTCSSTTNNSIIVNATPTSTFLTSVASLCIGANSTFTYNGTALPGATYSWNFGSGASTSSSTLMGPHTISWSTAGSKNVTLTVAQGGCTSTVTSQSITVNPSPLSTFSIPSTVCVGANASILYTGNASTPPSATYSWSVSGSSTLPGNVQGPFNLSWTTSGTKNLSLTVTEAGCSSTTSQTINVIDLPTVTIASANSSVCDGQATTFTASAQPVGTSYLWSFSSGASISSSSSASPVSVSWTGVSSGTASLIVTNGGCSSIAATSSISVVAPPTATISAPVSSCDGVPVSISATGVFAAGSTFNWNFDGAQVLSGSDAGPYSLQWTTGGTKNISLTVSSGSCSSTSSTSVAINAAGVYDFTFPTNVCEGQSSVISLVGAPSAGATYTWNFGSGASMSSSNLVGPHSVSWSTAGSKNVTLSVSQGGCSSTLTTHIITVNPSPISTFSIPASVCVGANATILYTGNASTPPSATYTWSVGGSTTVPGNVQAPSNLSWTTSGTKNLSLTVTEAGCSSTTSQTIDVLDLPIVSISSTNTSVCVGQSTIFSASAQAVGTSYLWSFSSGSSISSSSSASPVSVSWTGVSSGTASLIVTNGGCSSTSASSSISIDLPPTASISTAASGCVGMPVNISATGVFAAGSSFNWNFDGAQVISGSDAGPYSLQWSTGGSKNISLIVSTGSCSSTSSVTVVINATGLYDFTSPSNVCVGQSSVISLIGTPSAGATYNWDFGLGSNPSTASTAGPHNVIWGTAGSTSITLNVVENGCSSNAVVKNVQVNAIPTASFSVSPNACMNEYVGVIYTGNAGLSASFAWTYAGGTLISGSGTGPLALNYSNSGNVNIELQVTENGCTSALISQTVNIHSIPSFSIQSPVNTVENIPTSISFSGSQLVGSSSDWDFDGATIISGSGFGPYQVSWPAAGTYTISCTYNLNGCSVTETSVIQVIEPLQSAFSADSPVCENAISTITYTGVTLPSATFAWDFDGGTIVSGSGPGPFQISWNTPGAKSVTVEVTQMGVTNPIITQQVLVNQIPSATFVTSGSMCAGSDVTFNYTGSASSLATYNWNFGSGTLQNSIAGNSYTVSFPSSSENISLSVTENGCTSAHESLLVDLQPPPSSSFTSTSVVCEGASVFVNYTGGASSNIAFTWDFDGADIISGSAAGPIEIIYQTPGAKNITLQVDNGGCLSNTTVQSVLVNQAPSTSFNIVSGNCSSDSVYVTYTGNASSSATYVWDFESAVGYVGDGQGPYAALFPGSGSYPIGLFVMENGCMSDVVEVQVVLNASPIASFTLEDTVFVNQLNTVNFTGQSPQGSSMNWVYPNADLINGGAFGPFDLSWSSPGTYQVSLSMDNAGCIDGPEILDVVVLPLPTSTFSLSEDTICAGSSFTVTYSGVASNQANYIWSFDGATVLSGSGAGPYQLSWNSEGVHEISLVVEVDGISSAISEQYINVIDIPSALFSLPNHACVGSEVLASYSAITTLNAQFQWVTNGASVNDTDPSNVLLSWSQPGIKNVVLNVADAMCISSPVAQTITIHAIPQASISLPDYSCKNATIEVNYDGVQNSGATYTWGFGSAEILSGSNAGPYSLRYNSSGIQHITLSVSANGCSSSIADSSIITRDLPIANAGADTLVCAGDTIQLSTPFQPGYSYNWFPFAGISNDTLSNPQFSLNPLHNYIENFDYTVTVQDGYCVNFDLITLGIAPKPNAEFVFGGNPCSYENSFDFTLVNSFDPSASFNWNLGSHAFTHLPSDQMQRGISFDTLGQHVITLQVTENGCVSDLFSDTITVYPNPVARFTASNIKGCMPLTSLFEADSTNDENIHYVWSFGDGSTALGDSLSHTYLQSGYMSVTLIATNEHGCSSTYTEQDAIQVFEKPIAEFRTFPEIVLIGSDDLTLTNLSENALHSYYIIGSDTILGATTTYSFSDEGVYPITQVVTSGLGCSDEITHTVTVEFGSEYYVPSAFTPNNDGNNDEFKIIGSEIKEFSLVIFDRWGNEVFESDDINTSWDGIASKNNPMPEGVYVYRLEMRSKTNRDIVKSGAITLLR